MKARLLFPVLGLMLLVAACSEQSQVNDPITSLPTGNSSTLAKLNLSMDEAAFIDEMYYLEEDLSVLLTPSNFSVINEITADPGDRRTRGFADMAAIVYYNLIVKAGAADEAGLEQIRQWITESNARRAQIIADGLAAGLTREQIAAQLKTEHDALMALINGQLGAEGLAAIEAYKLKLQEEREKLRQAMLELRIDREVAIMKEKLGLTDEEAAAIKAALLEHHNALAGLRGQYKDDPEGLRAALAELLAKHEAKMISILGEERWQQWKDLRSGRTGEVRDPIAEQVKMLTQLLNLDQAQQTAIARILKNQQEQMKALVAKYGADRRGLAEALRQLQLETEKQIQGTLTPAQLEIYLKWRRGGIRPGGGGITPGGGGRG